jgi:hypothetical protein
LLVLFFAVASPLFAATNATTCAGAIALGDFTGLREALAEQIQSSVTAANVDQAAASLLLAQWQLTRDVDGLATVASHTGGKEFLAWLLSNRDALEEYHGIGAVLTLKPKRTHGLDGWREIWNMYPESREPGLWRRLAAACAAVFAEPGAEVTPRERYDFYREMHKAGNLVPYFDDALPFELALAIHGNGFSNDQFEWAQAATPKEKKTQAGVGNYGHTLVAYRGENYRGASVHGPEYYDRKPWHVATFMEYGAVCGRISMMNMMVANAHGAPAFTVGQPGHCAYVWKSAPKVWSGGNFVSGWMETHDAHQQPFWVSRYSADINLVSAAVEASGFARAERLRRLAAAWRARDPEKSETILAAATTTDAFHYGAWCERIEAALAWQKAPPNLWPTMATEIKLAFPKFPYAMTDLLGRFESQRLFAGYTDAERAAYAAVVARALTSVPAREQWDLIYPAWKPWFARQLAGFGIPEKNTTAILEENLVVKLSKKTKAKNVNADTAWEKVPTAKRPGIETLFASVLPAVESDAALYKSVASAWLALVAQDDAANARAGTFLQRRLAASRDLRELEMIGDAALSATRASADARASLVAVIRKRAASFKKPDPDAMDKVVTLLGRYDYRDANRIGAWNGATLAKGGEQTLEWDITPLLTRTVGEWAMHLNFRWNDGEPLAIKNVSLLEGDKEMSNDAHAAKRAEVADATLRPALFTVRLPQPKPGVKYVVRATASGAADSAGVVLFRAEPVATFNASDWVRIGGWGGKEIKAAPEINEGWHEMEFDATKQITAAGSVFVMFKYSSYGSPRIANVRLLVDGVEVSADPHSCNPISGANTLYALYLPQWRVGAKVAVRAVFTRADGWGNVFVRKPVVAVARDKKSASR